MNKYVTHVVAELPTPAIPAAPDVIEVPQDAVTTKKGKKDHGPVIDQLLLFGELSGNATRARQQRKGPAKAKLKRIKGKQYRLKMKMRAKERKIAYRPHAAIETTGNGESWSDQGMRTLHSILLKESLLSLRAMCEKRSARAAEIIAWMMRKEPTVTFSFEECCRLHYMDVQDPEDGEMDLVGALDPEVVRCMAMNWIKTAYGASLPHAAVLRKAILDAESGDPDALQWILSEQTSPLSFLECVDALGFEPEAARQEIRLPEVNITSSSLERDLDAIFERFLSPVSSAALAA